MESVREEAQKRSRHTMWILWKEYMAEMCYEHNECTWSILKTNQTSLTDIGDFISSPNSLHNNCIFFWCERRFIAQLKPRQRQRKESHNGMCCHMWLGWQKLTLQQLKSMTIPPPSRLWFNSGLCSRQQPITHNLTYTKKRAAFLSGQALKRVASIQCHKLN